MMPGLLLRPWEPNAPVAMPSMALEGDVDVGGKVRSFVAVTEVRMDSSNGKFRIYHASDGSLSARDSLWLV